MILEYLDLPLPASLSKSIFYFFFLIFILICNLGEFILNPYHLRPLLRQAHRELFPMGFIVKAFRKETYMRLQNLHFILDLLQRIFNLLLFFIILFVKSVGGSQGILELRIKLLAEVNRILLNLVVELHVLVMNYAYVLF